MMNHPTRMTHPRYRRSKDTKPAAASSVVIGISSATSLVGSGGPDPSPWKRSSPGSALGTDEVTTVASPVWKVAWQEVQSVRALWGSWQVAQVWSAGVWVWVSWQEVQSGAGVVGGCGGVGVVAGGAVGSGVVGVVAGGAGVVGGCGGVGVVAGGAVGSGVVGVVAGGALDINGPWLVRRPHIRQCTLRPGGRGGLNGCWIEDQEAGGRQGDKAKNATHLRVVRIGFGHCPWCRSAPGVSWHGHCR